MSETTTAFLVSQIFEIPVLLVYIIATAIAITRHPARKSALPAAWGFGLLTAGWLINAGYQYWQLSILKNGGSVHELGRVALAAGAASHLLQLVGLILVMLAVFSTKRGPASEN
jgi:hypothetical protein